MRATESVPMRLTGAVPEDQVIVEGSRFREMSIRVFAPLAHIGWSAAWLGTAAGAYSRVVTHIRSSEARGQFDPSSELLLDRLARTRARLETVHALLRHTVRVAASPAALEHRPAQALVNTLKAESADQCRLAVEELVEIVGLRHGYLPSSPLRLERAARDLRSAALNFHNDRLRRANGALALMDSGVRLV